MESDRDLTNADPDYEKYNLALKEIEEKSSEDELNSQRLHNIIAEEFDRELTIRQQQLEEIENKIFKAQKLLHLVRYVLISSYYKKRNLEFSSTSENPSTLVFDAQSRLHPAVKKLLGNNNSLELLTTRGKRKVHNKSTEENEVQDSYPQSIKKFKVKEECVSDNLKIDNTSNSQNSLKRKRVKHRILVGNISKWMPSLENDKTTHKWMVYVRGTKEAPDLSHMIDKVIFYLHPSYKPHDVVEVSEYPFHLSRRGWGEFPLRVQIFFKCTLNKPISIVHNLKLDKTYTGRQTLGNETLVDLYLHDNHISTKMENETLPNESFSSVKNEFPKEYAKEDTDCHIKVENETMVEIKDEPLTDFNNFEHNYYHDKEESADTGEFLISDVSIVDHNYSLPYSDSSDLSRIKKEDMCTDLRDQEQNNLIFGLDSSYEDENNKIGDNASKNKCVVRTFTTATGQPIRVLPQSFNRVLLSNGNVVQIKLMKTPQSFMKQVDCDTISERLGNPKEDRSYFYEYRMDFPIESFKNMGEVLPYLFKRLPLWNESAAETGFKRVYPYVASSEKEFFSWNIGKQLSSEWSRARAVAQILRTKNFPESEKWNTKSFFLYARSHGYSPLGANGVLFECPSKELNLLKTCFSHSVQRQSSRDWSNSDHNVDVVDDSGSSPTSRHRDKVDISDRSLRHLCAFVKDAALDCGIVLKSEEITEGVTWNGAERMILVAVRCLTEQLIRRARHHKVCQDGSRETVDVGVSEIKIAMDERSEIRSITEYQKRRLVKDFFS